MTHIVRVRLMVARVEHEPDAIKVVLAPMHAPDEVHDGSTAAMTMTICNRGAWPLFVAGRSIDITMIATDLPPGHVEIASIQE